MFSVLKQLSVCLLGWPPSSCESPLRHQQNNNYSPSPSFSPWRNRVTAYGGRKTETLVPQQCQRASVLTLWWSSRWLSVVVFFLIVFTMQAAKKYTVSIMSFSTSPNFIRKADRLNKSCVACGSVHSSRVVGFKPTKNKSTVTIHWKDVCEAGKQSESTN